MTISLFFSSLRSCISNYIGAFFVFFHWSDYFNPSSYNYGHLPLYAAVLVCLEHSFWFVQQGSQPVGGFIKAWESYVKTRRTLVDRELDNYLRSKGGNDWFTMGHQPYDEELSDYRKIVLNNLLRKHGPWN
jgi:hypothetical protein